MMASCEERETRDAVEVALAFGGTVAQDTTNTVSRQTFALVPSQSNAHVKSLIAAACAWQCLDGGFSHASYLRAVIGRLVVNVHQLGHCA
jgi:hypothetical protein